MECNLNIILNKLVIFRMILSRVDITYFIMAGIHISNIKIGNILKDKKKKKRIWQNFFGRLILNSEFGCLKLRKKEELIPR